MVAFLVSLPLLAEGGTLTGSVIAFPARLVEEAVVYLRDAPPPRSPRHHRVTQKGMRFMPHVLAIAARDAVTFVNDDGVDHNVFSTDGEQYNLGVFPRGQSRERVFAKPGVYAQQCSMHPEMLSYIFVGSSAYSAVVDKDGTFTIRDVPPGTWKLSVWHPRLSVPDQAVKVTAGATAVARIQMN
jgi:plastocyanin